MNIADDLKQLLESNLAEFNADSRVNLNVLTVYAAERAAHLSTLVGQPGFEEAVRAERDNVVLRAGIAATDAADAVDQRTIGIIHGVLLTGAKALLV